MAKKFVRGVTGIEDIESYDKTLTNVNDILSDGQDTYVHTKKGKNESYYKLTDSLKSVISDNSELITVTKDDTTNTATIHPKHDTQKEQSLQSTRSTITIQKGSNGTNTTTKVDTNPQKVLEHDNLLTDYGISKNTSGNTTKLGIEYTRVSDGFDLNNLLNGRVRAGEFVNGPKENTWFFVSAYSVGPYTIQRAITLKEDNNKNYIRLKDNDVWGKWREQVGEKSVIDGLLAQKQNNLTSNTSIGVLPNNQLRQLFFYVKTYTTNDNVIRINVKDLARPGSETNREEEFNFLLKIKKGETSTNFNLESQDVTRFTTVISRYGDNNSLIINGFLFKLSGSTLTVSNTANTTNNQLTSFSVIL